ncbi:MAG TPA: hypothetical protein VHC86_04415 [Opitutaceae bacterium]|nr:hypothetical protein [Opitutaceae bacterium]
MRNLLNKPWFVGLLCLAGCALAGRSLLAGRTEPAGPAAAPPGADPAEAAVAGPPSIDAALQALPARTPERDPFAGEARAPAGPAETLRLSAVWTQGGSTLALVNGRIVQAGDPVGSARVDSASDEGVWIVRGRLREFLALGQAVSLPAR